MENNTVNTTQNKGRVALLLSAGMAIGILFGVIATATLVVWGLTQAANADDFTLLSPIVNFTKTNEGDIQATSGNGVFILPIAGAVIGGAIGCLAGYRGRKKIV